MSEKMIFCIGEERGERGAGYQKNHHAFNKQVTKERFFEIDTEVKEILKSLNSNPNVKSMFGIDEWKKVTNAEWSKLSEIPEFDLDVVERIVGFRPYIDGLAEKNTESRKRLLKISKILNESNNLRAREEQNAYYWLMYAVDHGLDEAVDRFWDEAEIQNNK